MEVITVIVATFAFLALALSVWQVGHLTLLAIDQPGIGRIIFVSIVSLKLWAAMVVAYFLVGQVWPHLLSHSFRFWFRLLLAVYLFVHPVALNVALWRWDGAPTLLHLFRSIRNGNSTRH